MTFSASFTSTDNTGIQAWSVTSTENATGGAGAQPLRILPPLRPGAGHSFLYVLPVSSGLDFTFGDGVATLQHMQTHNRFNTTLVSPGFPVNPWYADNDLDPSTHQETFMLELVTWVTANLAVTGTEQHLLIGFSKSGIGSQTLLLRNPSVFAKAASWDFPSVNKTAYNLYNGSNDGGSGAVYGDQANYDSNYHLSTANVSRWSGPFTGANRIWIGGGTDFTSDISGYDTLLTSLGVVHSFTGITSQFPHLYGGGWEPAAVNYLFGVTPLTPVIPAQAPRARTEVLAGRGGGIGRTVRS